MRSDSSSTSARRIRRRSERRARIRPAVVAAGLAFGIAATAGFAGSATAAPRPVAHALTTFALASYATPAAVSVSSGSDQIASDARTALGQAETARAAAAAVQSDIAASGLDIGRTDTTVDTAALDSSVARLQGADHLPAPLVPDLTDHVTTAVTAVDVKVAGLRGSLDAAVALKAEQEAAAKAAAEQAQRDAEAAAKAAKASAAPKASTTTAAASSTPIVAAAASGDNSPGGAQATARGMLASYGWGDDQFGCLVSLWNRESGWRVNASSGSGAYGIPQALPGSKMASAGADWATSAATQIAWGFGYISGRYGSPCGAWAHSQSTGWY